MKKLIYKIVFPVNSQQSYLAIFCILWKFGSPLDHNNFSRASILRHWMAWIDKRKGGAFNSWICIWAMVKILGLHQRIFFCLCYVFIIWWYREHISVQMKAAQINQWIQFPKIIRFTFVAFMRKFVITNSVLWCGLNFFNWQTE